MIVAELFALLTLKPDKHGFESGEKLIHGLHHAIEGLLLERVFEWFKEAVEGTVELAHGLEILSARTGVATHVLQQLQFAAKQTGVDSEMLGTGLRFLARNADAAAQGGKQQAEAFKRLGLDVKDAHGNLKPANQLLMESADAFMHMENPSERAALAMKLFGRSGVALLPLLIRGREGIAELRQEFIELGGQLDKESIEKLAEFHQETLKLQAGIQGIKNQIALGLLPALQEITENMVEWIKENHALIQLKVREWFARISDFVIAAWPVVVRVVKDLWQALQILAAMFKNVWDIIRNDPGIKFITDMLGGFLKLMGVTDEFGDKIDGLTTLFVGLGVAMTAAALRGIVMWAAALGPIAAIAIAIADLIIALRLAVALMDKLKDDQKENERILSERSAVAPRARQIASDRGLMFEQATDIALAERQFSEKIALSAQIAKLAAARDIAKTQGISFDKAFQSVSLPAPVASLSQANRAAPQLHANVTVNAAPAETDRDTANLIVEKMDDWWKGVLRTVPQ